MTYPVLIDELLAFDGDISLVRLTDGNYVVGLSLRPDMRYTRLLADRYYGNSLDIAKRVYKSWITEGEAL